MKRAIFVLIGLTVGMAVLMFSGSAATDEGGIIAAYLCGDANGDDHIDIADFDYLIQYVFQGGPAPRPWAAGDVNCDGKVNAGDIFYLGQYLSRGGPAPCANCVSIPGLPPILDELE